MDARLLSLLSFLSATPYLLIINISRPMATATPTSKIAGPQIGNTVEVGQSSGYQKAANIILSAINQSVDPCDNFFEFACGRWLSENQIPEDQSNYGRIYELDAKVESEMKGLYESKETSQSRAINEIRQIYAACMDEQQLNQLRGTELVNAIQQMGYWPIVHGKKWRAKKYDLTDLLIYAGTTRAMQMFLTIYVAEDQRNVSRRLIYVDQANLGLDSRDYYLDTTEYEEQLKAYKQYITNKAKLVAEDAGEPIKKKRIAKGVKEIINLETSIAKVMVSEDDRRDYSKMYNPYKLSDLNDLFPLVDWNKYFKAMMPDELHEYLDTNPDIIVNEVDYLKKVTNLLKTVDARILTNYIVWRYTSAWSLQLGSRYDDISQDFLRVLIGKEVKSPRWKDCSAAASSRMEDAASAIYAREYFNTKDKEAVLDMIKDLHDAFRDMVSHNDWMDEQTKKIAIEKSKAMQSLIGYPDFVLSDKKLDDHYKLLKLEQGDTYASMAQKTTKWLQDHWSRKLIEPVDRTEFEFSSSTVNAFYAAPKNAIMFPAAILQSPLFDRTFPKAVNYGSIGSVIGHEITHGFDDQGSQFDKDGNLLDWWDQATKEQFNKRTGCIVEQYSKFSLPGTDVHVNGLLTQGENIADNGGVKEAYKAYKNRVKKSRKDEKRLPGLEKYTNDQIFFMSFAQSWCGKSKPAAARELILTDPHSPPQFRVEGAAVNQPEFAEAFQCASGTAMNPVTKCDVW